MDNFLHATRYEHETVMDRFIISFQIRVVYLLAGSVLYRLGGDF